MGVRNIEVAVARPSQMLLLSPNASSVASAPAFPRLSRKVKYLVQLLTRIFASTRSSTPNSVMSQQPQYAPAATAGGQPNGQNSGPVSDRDYVLQEQSI